MDATRLGAGGDMGSPLDRLAGLGARIWLTSLAAVARGTGVQEAALDPAPFGRDLVAGLAQALAEIGAQDLAAVILGPEDLLRRHNLAPGVVFGPVRVAQGPTPEPGQLGLRLEAPRAGAPVLPAGDGAP